MMTLFKLCVIQPDAVRSLRLGSLMVEVKGYVQPIKYNTSVCLSFYHCPYCTSVQTLSFMMKLAVSSRTHFCFFKTRAEMFYIVDLCNG